MFYTLINSLVTCQIKAFIFSGIFEQSFCTALVALSNISNIDISYCANILCDNFYRDIMFIVINGISGFCYPD